MNFSLRRLAGGKAPNPQRETQPSMARDRNTPAPPSDTIISIIGPGMKVVGDLETEGTIRIESNPGKGTAVHFSLGN